MISQIFVEILGHFSFHYFRCVVIFWTPLLFGTGSYRIWTQCLFSWFFSWTWLLNQTFFLTSYHQMKKNLTKKCRKKSQFVTTMRHESWKSICDIDISFESFHMWLLEMEIKIGWVLTLEIVYSYMNKYISLPFYKVEYGYMKET